MKKKYVFLFSIFFIFQSYCGFDSLRPSIDWIKKKPATAIVRMIPSKEQAKYICIQKGGMFLASQALNYSAPTIDSITQEAYQLVAENPYISLGLLGVSASAFLLYRKNSYSQENDI